jgi:hypothetical protein
MKTHLTHLLLRLYDPRYQLLFRLILCITLMATSAGAFADGDDLLKGTDAAWWATFNGTGKNYLYAGEGVIALLGFIKTRNPGVLIGIVVVAIFINIVLYFAGQTS